MQLVKHKNTRVYLCYICKYNKEMVHNTQGNQDIEHEERTRIQHLLHEVLTETTLVQPIMSSLPYTLVHAKDMRYQS